MQPVTVVSPGQSPRRLDVFVAAQTALRSGSAVRRWIDGGLVTVNGRPAKAARRIRPGDVIACHVPVRQPPPIEPEPLPLDVLHEDAALLVVNKPSGMVVHPAPGHWSGTLLNALAHHAGPAPADRRRQARSASPGRGAIRRWRSSRGPSSGAQRPRPLERIGERGQPSGVSARTMASTSGAVWGVLILNVSLQRPHWYSMYQTVWYGPRLWRR